MSRIARILVGILCFGPPLLIAFGIAPEITGPIKVSSWGLQGLLTAWWGRLLLAAAWFALGWLCYRSVYARGSAP